MTIKEKMPEGRRNAETLENPRVFLSQRVGNRGQIIAMFFPDDAKCFREGLRECLREGFREGFRGGFQGLPERHSGGPRRGPP